MLTVVTVAVALAGTVTDTGLTAHTGMLVVCCEVVTLQLRLIVPLNPLTEPIWSTDDATPPGPTASGSNGFAVSVNSEVPCAAAKEDEKQENAIVASTKQTNAVVLGCRISFTLDSNHSDLNMNEVWFN